ncbi:fumarylacetoacetase [Falsiroseomonas selenitidurans]|uniref:fumarylacetoacetase n=1 Tax=Falsiroseomonas selenitidurans TaxID=2716335 RepID=A0ABX1E060_9PROT|nr:fumarylacetoacetase [Falsiroseomonas selenitidurans]NKC30030.1 fumarylacetoacetase [Falsiroseomonas selenitidurans]
MIDATHDAARRSCVASANGHPDFPLQNLPLGIFAPQGEAKRPGTAIGDSVLDLAGAVAAGLLTGAAAEAVAACRDGTLNALLGAGAAPRQALRAQLSALLAEGADAEAALGPLLHEADRCKLHLPARIGDYTDFYAGIQHATNVGALFRPDNPLLPNYKHVPIGYHGRASSIVPSGTALRRPNGQRKPAAETEPSFGPSRNLDYELELAIWIGPGNALGEPIGIGQAAGHIAGYGLLNDWSARDIQGWEYQPLGPFLAKNFGSTISPWIITPEALAPFRVPQPARPAGDPAPMAYLWDEDDQENGALALELEVWLMTPGLAKAGLPAHRLSLGDARGLYWTPAQMVAHHACGGCNLQPGDLLGSGTISIPGGDGSLLEISQGGRKPLELPSGETRRFLEDGDEVTLRARAVREGFASIGFGDCTGRILPAP